jgi:L-ascorbate metabolism protein UlaG (beta-lactamase superfamily)
MKVLNFSFCASTATASVERHSPMQYNVSMKAATLLCALSLSLVAYAAGKPEEFKTSAGTLTMTPIQHAGLMLQAGGQVVQIDPAQGGYDGFPAADLILITDIHGDHLSAPTIAKLRKTSTVIMAPEAVAKSVTGVTVIRNGETKTAGAWTIEAIPMYNLTRGPSAGQLYHDKGRGNGYVITYGGLRMYVAGDTENIPEMRALKNIDVAFIPMNLPYTMTPEEAASAVKAFKPKIVYPYHYQGSDLKAFETALNGSGIEVRLRDWYSR